MPHKTLLKGIVGALVGGVWFVTATTGTSADPVSTTTATAVATPLTPESARNRIITLRSEIAAHDARYFQHAAPEISDTAYDTLKRELHTLERAFPAEAAASAPLPALADDHTEGFGRAVHRVPMLSLDKAYTESELRAFCAKVSAVLGHPATFVVEPKIDGLAVSACYARGRLVRASTRGNGREGDDITANARAIRSLPHELRATNPDGTPTAIPDFVELRGEIYLSQAGFAQLNRERETTGEPPLAHPRNVAAGAIKSNDPSDTANSLLDVVFYGWGEWEPATARPATQQAFHLQAKTWGLPVLETYQVTHDADETWAAVQALGRRRATLVAPTDGAVIKLDDVAGRPALGESAQAPRWALAYKYTPERATTQLCGITVQVGRTGLLTPVAELTPVSLAGSTVSRASLHNRDVISRLDVRAGDFVYIEKAGEIIPEIAGVDLARRSAQSTPYLFPTKCPACGAAVIVSANSAETHCSNFSGCPAQLSQRLAYFAGKTGVSIAGLGTVTTDELIARGIVRSPADLYRLQLKDLMALPGFGEKSAGKLLAAIERSRHAELWRFINGLGIPRVGPATARILARHFGSLEKLAAEPPVAFPATLGNSTLKAVQAHFAVPENRAATIALARAVRPSAP